MDNITELYLHRLCCYIDKRECPSCLGWLKMNIRTRIYQCIKCDFVMYFDTLDKLKEKSEETVIQKSVNILKEYYRGKKI